MKKTLWRVISIVLALAVMLPAGLGLAAGLPEEIPACTGDNVQGTIIAVDENGVITVDTETGPCSVTLNGNYSHPIVTLLGTYFGDLQVGDFSDALLGATGCAIDNGGTYEWAECGEGTLPIQFVSFDGTTLTAILIGTGEEITITIGDSSVAETINGALAQLLVDWALDGSGDVVQVSDQIAMYHDEGMGFGVLVKLYSLAQASGVPVEELIALFKGDPATGVAGVGMGQLFKEYGGKPPLLGVGHVRKALNNLQNGQTSTTEGTTIEQNTNGKGKGKSNNNANGKNKTKNTSKGKGKGKNYSSNTQTGSPAPNCIPKSQAKPNTPPQRICP